MSGGPRAPRSDPPRCPASASALLAATLLRIARNVGLLQPAASSTHRPTSPPSSVDHPPAAATSMPAVAEDGVSVSDDKPLAFLWPEHLRRPRARLTVAKDTAGEGAAAHLESDVAAMVAVAVPVPVAGPAAGPEEEPPAPLLRMPWRTPPPLPPPPPPQPPQPPQPRPSERGRGARGRGGRDGSVGRGGGAAGGGGGGSGGGAASGGDSAGPVPFGFVLDARFRRGGAAGWLLHHPSLPRPPPQVQQELAQPGSVERFVTDPADVAAIRDCFAGLHAVGPGRGSTADSAVEDALASPGKYVLKPQREGGGNNFYGDELKERLESAAPGECQGVRQRVSESVRERASGAGWQGGREAGREREGRARVR